MPPEELKVLGDDINKNGMKVPIVILHDKDGEFCLLDGRNRLDALEAVGVDLAPLFEAARNFKPLPQLSVRYVAEAGFPGISGLALEHNVDTYAFVASVNLHRRHLTPAQQRELIDGLLKEKPERSDRETAKIATSSYAVRCHRHNSTAPSSSNG
jgi:ParB-like nuclease domain